jgi:alkaline phosphatase D
MLRSLVGFFLIVCGFSSCLGQDTVLVKAAESVAQVQQLPKRIAFGSCAHQDKPQPVLTRVVEHSPDLFIYLGDNIYGDSRNMDVLKAKYAKLASKPEFQSLRKSVPILSIWDDHDYGENDAGKDYPFHRESRELFLDFWQVPADSPRRTHDGIYGSHVYQSQNRTLQIILLDTRSFRSPLKKNPSIKSTDGSYKNDYQPDRDPTKTILGQTQWDWLETQLKVPADLRIIASSIQFGHEYNGYESWTNLPLEQERMLETIRRTKASGVLFLSGDVHWAEISRREFPDLYPLYDVTASGITEMWYKIEPNSFRVGKAVPENHFGMIEIDWNANSPQITLKIINHQSQTKCVETVDLKTLQFGK